MRTTSTLGDLITTCYAEFLAMYGDEELASLATAAVVNDLLLEEDAREDRRLLETPTFC